MFHLATSELTHFQAAYGYWAVLLFVALESTGIPFPGETMLLVAFLAFGRRNEQRLEEEAEQAFPGGLDVFSL